MIKKSDEKTSQFKSTNLIAIEDGKRNQFCGDRQNCNEKKKTFFV